jgi:hypothetical protein
VARNVSGTIFSVASTLSQRIFGRALLGVSGEARDIREKARIAPISGKLERRTPAAVCDSRQPNGRDRSATLVVTSRHSGCAPACRGALLPVKSC